VGLLFKNKYIRELSPVFFSLKLMDGKRGNVVMWEDRVSKWRWV
jgi:hypothetical protein